MVQNCGSMGGSKFFHKNATNPLILKGFGEDWSCPTLSAKIRSPLIRQDQGVFRFGAAARPHRVASSMQPGCMMNTIAP